MSNLNLNTNKPFSAYEQLDVTLDEEREILWYAMKHSNRPCFTPELLSDLRNFQEEASTRIRAEHLPVKYLVVASQTPSVFNLGGDLNLFKELIEKRDRNGLASYGKACIDILYPNYMSLDLPVTTISLIQGKALGGGMEAAISSNVIIAERSAQMGLPEILFNMFPGMGAYSFLSRQVGPKMAERIILSGDTFSAEQLYEMGVVDIVCDDGEGVAAIHDFVKRQKRMGNSTTAMQKVARRVNPVPYQELIDVTEIWADAALKLTEKDLRKMERLVRAQNKLDITSRPVVNIQHVA